MTIRITSLTSFRKQSSKNFMLCSWQTFFLNVLSATLYSDCSSVPGKYLRSYTLPSKYQICKHFLRYRDHELDILAPQTIEPHNHSRGIIQAEPDLLLLLGLHDVGLDKLREAVLELLEHLFLQRGFLSAHVVDEGVGGDKVLSEVEGWGIYRLGLDDEGGDFGEEAAELL